MTTTAPVVKVIEEPVPVQPKRVPMTPVKVPEKVAVPVRRKTDKEVERGRMASMVACGHS